jgi:hypothetical protein
MAQNDYQIFGDSGVDGVNKLSLANYTADNDRLYGNGYTTKVVRSQLHNKVLQQTSKISAAVAQFLVNNGISALDTDSVSTISANIQDAVATTSTNASQAVGFHTSGVVGISSSAILTAADAGQVWHYNSLTAGTLTLPPASIGNNSVYTVSCIASGALTINAVGTDLIFALGINGTNSIVLNQGDSVQLVTDGVSWIQVSGNNVTLSQFSNSLGTNGFQKLPNGMIMQWGVSGSFSAEGGQTVTFPIAFPNMVLTCNSELVCSTVGPYNDVSAQSFLQGKTSLGLYLQVMGSGAQTFPYTINWSAIGY